MNWKLTIAQQVSAPEVGEPRELQPQRAGENSRDMGTSSRTFTTFSACAGPCVCVRVCVHEGVEGKLTCLTVIIVTKKL